MTRKKILIKIRGQVSIWKRLFKRYGRNKNKLIANFIYYLQRRNFTLIFQIFQFLKDLKFILLLNKS